MNCLFSGAIARIGGAQKRAGGVASAKYSFASFVFASAVILGMNKIRNTIMGMIF